MSTIAAILDPETGSYRWSDTKAWQVVAEVPLVETFVPLLKARPDRAFITFEDGTVVTNAEVLERAEKVAGWAMATVPTSDPIAMAIGNRAEFFIAWLALLSTGHAMVSMNPAGRTSEVVHMLRDSGARVAISDSSSDPVLRAALADCPDLELVHLVDGPEPDGLAGLYSGHSPRDLLTAPPPLSTVTSITYTSGTTGIPKGCAHVQGELVRYADVNVRVYDFSEDDKILNPLLFFYGDAIWMMTVSIVTGASFVSMRKFSVSRFWDVVRNNGVTVLVGIGAIPNLLLKRQPGPDERDHSVRLAIQIGIPPKQHAELIERFGFPWLEAYGLSETGPNILMPPGLGEAYVGSGALGLPVPELRAVLLDPEGNTLEGAAIGELAVDGPYMMAGYLNQPAETERITHGDFYRTGDEIERDVHGVYYFRGRLKEIIRRAGENIAPFEVEEILRLHPGVQDVAVVPVEDELRGEEVKAYVLPTSDDIDIAELIAFTHERLAPHKVPRYVELRTEPFPRTPSQRILKAALKVDGRHTTESSWDRTKETA
ncbi:ATP-dependent acyl-CoA ligase [Aeromicrobium panaciterrae]|uniref:class I adenylate-forming enzyme family protein n=1 Tax=Aeromicrobium panaciterrae TaxID=363861 RepID=UPI0031D8ECEC